MSQLCHTCSFVFRKTWNKIDNNWLFSSDLLAVQFWMFLCQQLYNWIVMLRKGTNCIFFQIVSSMSSFFDYMFCWLSNRGSADSKIQGVQLNFPDLLGTANPKFKGSNEKLRGPKFWMLPIIDIVWCVQLGKGFRHSMSRKFKGSMKSWSDPLVNFKV